MSKLLSSTAVSILLAASLQAVAAPALYQASSSHHRTAMLELYTSEGCSSCPPTDAWLSTLKESDKVVPLAFHVTYWDYIGWKDPFSDLRYDNRQREIERFNDGSTLYTPQLVLDGKDYRSRSDFWQDIEKIDSQSAPVDLAVSALVNGRRANVTMDINIENAPVKEVAMYLAVYENNLSSQVNAGENQGRMLRHDFVVRQLYGPFIQSQPNGEGRFKQSVGLLENWKRKDLNLVLFAQNPNTGEVLQAVKLALNH
jgi:hypothetical protein